MATVDNEAIATMVVMRLYFTVEELEKMLANTKVGGYTAVRIETNGGGTNVSLEYK